MMTRSPKPTSFALVLSAFVLVALSAPARAGAAACDSAAEAWSVAGAAIDALDAGDFAAARTLAEPLIGHDCAPAGSSPEAALVRRAVLEARLVRLEASARSARAALARTDLSRARFDSREAFEAWTVRVLFPLARRIDRTVGRDVMPEAAALLRDSRDEPAVRAAVASVVAELAARVAAVLDAAPRPASLREDPEFANAYREAVTQVTRPWLDAARDAVNLARSLSRNGPLDPRGARRAAALRALETASL